MLLVFKQLICLKMVSIGESETLL